MEIAPGLFTTNANAEGWEPDEEIGGEVLVLCEGVGVDAGMWRVREPLPAPLVYTTPGRETIVVLEGSLRIEIEGSPTLDLKPGDLASIPAGAKTTWHVTPPFLECWLMA